MKILLIGCNGLLGRNLLRTVPAQGLLLHGMGLDPGPALPERLAGYRRVDISRREDLQGAVAALNPDLILNAAAYTDVDGCERNPGLCYRVNRDAVGWIAACGAPMVHISTDYVFDGENGPYSEQDPVRPLSVYGRAKLESEALVLGAHPRSLVLRTMTLWGRGGGGKTSFVEFVRRSLEEKKSIKAVTDQWGNPTLAEDLAKAVWMLVESGRSGLYHVAGSEWNSRFDWARAIARFYGLDADLILPCVSSDLNQVARRPLRSGLKIDKLVRDTGFRPGNVEEQLRRVQQDA